MIKITKDERDWLEKNGFKFGSTLHHTLKNKAYYMTESKEAMKCLMEYRNRCTSFEKF